MHKKTISILIASALSATMAGKALAQDLTPISMVFFTASSESIQAGVMVEQKIFEKNGLLPTFANATSGPAITSALASGTVQFGTGYPSLYLPALKLKRDLVVAGPFAEPLFYSLIAQPEMGVPDPGKGLTEQAKSNLKLMEGKTVGVTALGAQTQVFVELLAQEADVDIDKITFIATGGAASAISAFQNKGVDFLVTFMPEDAMFKEAGVDYTTIVNVNTGPDNTFGNLINDLWLANGEFIRKNPETALAFCRATVEARQFISDPANEEAVLDVIQKYQALTREGAKMTYDAYRYIWEPVKTTYIDEELWQRQSQYLTGTANEGYVPPYDAHINEACMELGQSVINN